MNVSLRSSLFASLLLLAASASAEARPSQGSSFAVSGGYLQTGDASLDGGGEVALERFDGVIAYNYSRNG
jgi:hypothetical protein